MLKILITLAIKINLPAILRLAAKLEYGAGIFCFKLSQRAADDGYPTLYKNLRHQYAQEDAHAKMLGSLIDGQDRLKRNFPTGTDSHKKWEPFDGISQRYWAAKLFFWFKKPEQLDWADTLAFMSVIEVIVASFYEVLAQNQDGSVRAIASKILAEELDHSEYLKLALSSFHSSPESMITKWEDRVILGAIGGVLDLIEKFFRNLLELRYFLKQ